MISMSLSAKKFNPDRRAIKEYFKQNNIKNRYDCFDADQYNAIQMLFSMYTLNRFKSKLNKETFTLNEQSPYWVNKMNEISWFYENYDEWTFGGVFELPARIGTCYFGHPIKYAFIAIAPAIDEYGVIYGDNCLAGYDYFCNNFIMSGYDCVVMGSTCVDDFFNFSEEDMKALRSILVDCNNIVDQISYLYCNNFTEEWNSHFINKHLFWWAATNAEEECKEIFKEYYNIVYSFLYYNMPLPNIYTIYDRCQTLFKSFMKRYIIEACEPYYRSLACDTGFDYLKTIGITFGEQVDNTVSKIIVAKYEEYYFLFYANSNFALLNFDISNSSNKKDLDIKIKDWSSKGIEVKEYRLSDEPFLWHVKTPYRGTISNIENMLSVVYSKRDVYNDLKHWLFTFTCTELLDYVVYIFCQFYYLLENNVVFRESLNSDDTHIRIGVICSFITWVRDVCEFKWDCGEKNGK